MADHVPFWKKEISIGRKPKAVADESAATTRSVLKQEMSSGRKAADAAKAGQVPFWKREISFGGKRRSPAGTESTPLLKREFSFGRPSARKKVEETPLLRRELSLRRTGQAAPNADQVPFWKKEISLGRKRKQKDLERLVLEAAKVVAPPPEPVLAAPVPIVPEVLPELPAPTFRPVAWLPSQPVATQPVGLAPLPAPMLSARGTEPTPPVIEAVAKPVLVPPATDDGPEIEPIATFPTAAVADEPVPGVVEPAFPVDRPSIEPIASAPLGPATEDPGASRVVIPLAPLTEPASALPPLPGFEAAVDGWGGAPEPLPGPMTAPQDVVHPFVAAAELPLLPAEAAQLPFWKREIGGKRKSRPLPENGAAETAPFWKKQLGGKKKTRVAARTAAAVQPEAAVPKTPFWKKQIGVKSKPANAAGVVAAGDLSVPFWKRGPELSLPALSNGRGPKHGAKGNPKSKRLVGLKIGASQLAAARVVNNGSAELLQLARRPLEPGIVVGGELRDPEALAEQLKIFFSANKLPRKNVRLGIASNRIGVRIFDVVGIQDTKALTNAIQFRAQEALPIPLDEAVLDYHVLSESVDGEGQLSRRILLVVAYRELVERYIAACRKAGIILTGIDLEAFALLRALAAPRPADVDATAAFVAVSIGYDRSTFAVSDGRVCEFTRVLEWGGAALNVALARALDRAPSEVENIKLGLRLDGTGESPAGLSAEQWAAALDAVRKQLQIFARELVSSLQYYQNQPGTLGIGEIVVTGGTAHLPGLAEELQRLIGVRVRVGDPFVRLKVAKKIGFPEQLGSLAVAIGLGIED
ncbi:MAG: type IV pilus assembly protein PilM [Gaiellaceae bacterium]